MKLIPWTILFFVMAANMEAANGKPPFILPDNNTLNFSADEAAQLLRRVPIVKWYVPLKVFVADYSTSRPAFVRCIKERIRENLSWLAETADISFEFVDDFNEANFWVVSAPDPELATIIQNKIDKRVLSLPRTYMVFYSSESEVSGHYAFDSLRTKQAGIFDVERVHVGYFLNFSGEIQFAYIWYREKDVMGEAHRIIGRDYNEYKDCAAISSQGFFTHRIMVALGVYHVAQVSGLTDLIKIWLRPELYLFLFRTIYQKNISMSTPTDNPEVLRQNISNAYKQH